MSNEDNRKSTLASTIEAAVKRILSGTYVLETCRVEEYDPVTQKVTVQPLLKRNRLDNSELELLPIIQGVPVWFPRVDARSDAFPGGPQAHITFPVKPGTNVMCLFSDKSLDKWKATGGEVNPQSTRSHALSDAVALPGLFPFNNPIPSVDPSDIRIQLIWADRGIDTEFYLGGDTGDIVMRPSTPGGAITGLIRLGSSSSFQSLILGELFKVFFDAHVHSTGVGPSGPPSIPMPATVLSDKAKTEK